MKKKCYVFPGQGAQFVGMGKNEYEKYESCRPLFHKANEILGFDICKIMFEGSIEELKETRVTQPAVYLHSFVLFHLFSHIGTQDVFAGHSLGEFTALVAAGVISFEDGMKLVAKRALYMQKSCEEKESGMVAVIGLADEIVENACREIKDEVVVPANYNKPGQLVLSGSKEGLTKVCALLQLRGVKRLVPLHVNGGFHSPMMQSAEKELEKEIYSIPFKDAHSPIFQNIDGNPYKKSEMIQKNLIQQLTSPVRWTDTIYAIKSYSIDEFIECGPGKILSGLIKQIDNTSKTSHILDGR